jgi:hypothetical protein
VQGCNLYQRPASIFVGVGESCLRGPVTLAPGQEVLLPLAGDLKVDGRMDEHVDAPSFVRLSSPKTPATGVYSQALAAVKVARRYRRRREP